MIIGYCAVTVDILHQGHIRFINTCKKLCDYLIVGVMTDECVKRYKGKYPILFQDTRRFIIENIKAVDKVIWQDTFEFDLNKLRNIEKVNIIFDSKKHCRKGTDEYIDYIEGISSSIIKNKIHDFEK